jgi:hypothetical protein
MPVNPDLAPDVLLGILQTYRFHRVGKPVQKGLLNRRKCVYRCPTFIRLLATRYKSEYRATGISSFSSSGIELETYLCADGKSGSGRTGRGT